LTQKAEACVLLDGSQRRYPQSLSAQYVQEGGLAGTVRSGYYQTLTMRERNCHRWRKPPDNADVVRSSKMAPVRGHQIGKSEHLRRLWNRNGVRS
jgi:hypothetical protein